MDDQLAVLRRVSALTRFAYGLLDRHYAPVYGSYIQHMNAKLSGRTSLWDDIWPAEEIDGKGYKALNLTGISIGNGWINGRIQYRAMVEFACGGAKEIGVPFLAGKDQCAWAERGLAAGEKLLDKCEDRIEW